MNVVILDTGCANLASVTYAVRRLGYQPEVSRDPEIVLRADKLFLPGVGTAQAAMDQLRERDLISVPPGIYRGLFNHGEEEALMCVMLGTNKPEIPTYPADHPLSKVKRN